MSSKTYYFQSCVRGGKIKGYPVQPVVNICLKTWTEGDEDMPPTISPDLMSDSEIDYHIDKLKKELEVVRREAKRGLKTKFAESLTP